MKALVTGGGGFLGRAIVEQLLARGDAVTILSRSRYPEVEALGAAGLAVDLSTDTPDLAEQIAGHDTVFHVAARAGVWGPRESFFDINVGSSAKAALDHAMENTSLIAIDLFTTDFSSQVMNIRLAFLKP